MLKPPTSKSYGHGGGTVGEGGGTVGDPLEDIINIILSLKELLKIDLHYLMDSLILLLLSPHLSL